MNKQFENWVGDEESIEEEIKRVKGKEDEWCMEVSYFNSSYNLICFDMGFYYWKEVKEKMNEYIREVKVNKRIEEYSEPKLDLSILKKRSSGKTSSGICLGYIKKLHGKVPNEFILVLQNMYRDIKNLEVSETFKAKQWRGKSGVSYQIKPDYVVAIRFRKKDIGEKPTEVRTEMSKNQINKIRWTINQLNKNNL